MSVAVKMRHIEKNREVARPGVVLRFSSKTPVNVIKNIEREYANYLLDGDDELVVWEETGLARTIEARMTPGKYLHHLRDAQGMTQQDIGDKTGHRASYISDMETGQRAISRMTAKKLAEIFNVSPGLFI